METAMHADPITPDGPPEAQAHDATLAALTATRAIIAAGWTQGVFRREVDGVMCHCLTAAAIMAHAGKGPGYYWQCEDEWPPLARNLIIAKLSSTLDGEGEFSDRVRDLTAWNDHPRRTQDDVFALIDRAIAAQVAA
jgi:hypothetical protein